MLPPSSYSVSVLKENKDDKYALFQSSLIPNVSPESIIGVRTPVLRKVAKELIQNNVPGVSLTHFLKELPHRYFEENQLHGFVISDIKDFQKCIMELEKFLPYMDNWATCDQTSPKVFQKNKEKLMPYILKWVSSNHTYTVRFAIGMLMRHFLGKDFTTEHLEIVAGVSSEEYYVKMEIAWYMATALAKQWESTIPYLENYRLEKWVHSTAPASGLPSWFPTPKTRKRHGCRKLPSAPG